MMLGDSIVQYYPIPICPSLRRRDMLMSYGTCGAVNVDIEVNSINVGNVERTEQIKFVCQTVHDHSDERFELLANNPSAPLFPPNKYVDVSIEPCTSVIKEDLTKHKKILSSLKLACTRMRLKSNQVLAQEALEMLLLQRDESCRNDVSHRKNRFTKQLEMLATRSKDIIGKSLCNSTVNRQYTGGCLQFVNSAGNNQIDDGVLLLPTGQHLDEISFQPVTVCNNKIEVTSGDSRLQLTDRIYETAVTTVYNQTFAVCRHGKKCSVIKMLPDNKNEICAAHSFSNNETSTAVCMSPYIPGECLIASNLQSAYIWSLNTQPRCITHEPTNCTEPLWNTWFGCHFGSHPRLVVISNRTDVSLLDLRRPSNACTQLLQIPQTFLHKDDYISASYQHPLSPGYHFIATNCSIVLMDERYPNYPVLLWHHNLISSPLYLDVVSNVLPGCSDDVLLVGCQDPPETHCFQFRLNESLPQKKYPPQACGIPWRISALEDCVLIAMMERQSKGYSTLLSRLTAPLVGMCSIPHTDSSGFSVVQMTSFGDTFSQSYEAVGVDSTSRYDKTYSEGLGSDAIKPSVEYMESVCHWLDEAMLQLSLDKKKTSEQDCIINDAQQLLQRLCRCDVSDASCPLCNPCLSSESVRNETKNGSQCAACNHSIDASFTLLKCRQSELYTEHEDTVVINLPDSSDLFTSFDEHVLGATAVEFSDPESRLLTKLWNENNDIDEELQHRSVRDRQVMKDRGMIQEQRKVHDDDDDDDVEYDSVDEETDRYLPTADSHDSIVNGTVATPGFSSLLVDENKMSCSSSDDETVQFKTATKLSQKPAATAAEEDDDNMYLNLLMALQPDLTSF